MRLAAALFFLVCAHGAWAVELDSATEERYRALLYELRCLVCQNQSLADSDAELAGDLRARVRRLMQEGRSDEEVIAHLRARYGDYVLYRPPFSAVSAALWVGPFVLLALFSVLLLRRIRTAHARRPARMSDAERAQLENILDDPGAD